MAQGGKTPPAPDMYQRLYIVLNFFVSVPIDLSVTFNFNKGSSMKVSTRLTAGFGLLICLFIICSGIAFNALDKTRESMDDIVNVRMKKFSLATDMGVALRNMLVEVRNMALFSDPQAIESEWERFQQQKSLYLQKREALASMIKSGGIQSELQALSRVASDEHAALSTLEEAASMGQKRQLQGIAEYLTDTVRPPQQRLVASLNTLTELQMKAGEDAVRESGVSVKRNSLVLGLLILLSILSAVGACVFTVRALMCQLGGEPARAQALAAAIAGGDLNSSVELRKNDTTSLLASLGGMQVSLRGLVSQIKDTSVSVAQTSDEIAQGNTELSSRTEQQASALQETAASMEQLSVTVKRNTTSAQQTADLAREAATLVHNSESDVKRMGDAMNNISASAAKIRDITEEIEGIAFQTNILALNAAVEAARAGEQGRGFAVVAGEVRALAQRSAVAAKDIRELTEEAVVLVESGVTVADGTGKSITHVVSMISELAGAMDDMVRASSEQMQGVSQISVALNQMDGVTQNNAALVEESSAASQSLSQQAYTLRGMVETFQV